MARVEPTDRAFIELYLQGDPPAVARVDEWIEAAARSFRRRLGGAWEDVVGEVRVEVFRLLRAGSFRGEANLKTYLWRVVGHTCLDHLRRGQRWKWVELEEGETSARWPGEPAPAGERRESRDLLLRVLAEMSEECRNLWSRIVAGMSYREIGLELGVAEGTLRVRALRCRQRALEVRDRLLAAG